MRMDKLTSRFQQAIADAQSLAVGRDHNLIEPTHLLVALIDQQGGGTRPLLGQADYRGAVPALYLCGSGTHPGGGVTGLPGRNAARELLRDLRRTPRPA